MSGHRAELLLPMFDNLVDNLSTKLSKKQNVHPARKKSQEF